MVRAAAIATLFAVFSICITTFFTETAVAGGPEALLGPPAGEVTVPATDVADQPLAGDAVAAVEVVAQEGGASVERALASAAGASAEPVATSSDVVDETLSPAEPAVEEVTDATGDAATGAAGAAGGTVVTVTSAVAPITEDIANTVAPAAETVSEAVAPAAAAVSPVVEDAAAVASPATEPARDAIAATQPVVAPAEPVVAPVVEAIANAAAPVVQEAAPVVAPVAAVGNETGAPVAEVVGDTRTPVAEPVASIVAPAAEVVAETGAPVMNPVGGAVAPVTGPTIAAAARLVAPASGIAPGTPPGARGPAVQPVVWPVLGGLTVLEPALTAPSDGSVPPPEDIAVVGWVIGGSAVVLPAPTFCDAIAGACERGPAPGLGGGGEIGGIDLGRVWAGTPAASRGGIGLPGVAADRSVLSSGTPDELVGGASRERRAGGTMVEDVCTAVTDFTQTLAAEALSAAGSVLELGRIMPPDPGLMDFSDADDAWRSVARIVAGLTFLAFLLFAFWRLAHVPRPLGS